jgi:hypothetical protein
LPRWQPRTSRNLPFLLCSIALDFTRTWIIPVTKSSLLRLRSGMAQAIFVIIMKRMDSWPSDLHVRNADGGERMHVEVEMHEAQGMPMPRKIRLDERAIEVAEVLDTGTARSGAMTARSTSCGNLISI